MSKLNLPDKVTITADDTLAQRRYANEHNVARFKCQILSESDDYSVKYDAETFMATIVHVLGDVSTIDFPKPLKT